MVGLIDIAPKLETIDVQGTSVAVAERRRRRRAAEQLGLQALASRAEANVLKRKIEDLQRE